ncbi:hypothetical protein [Prosthecobacter sp.]|uniref:hypothetical protein n=1 Tax=Prosthecobacter sp. TaxID=1965333 RepID=UPI0024895AA5|nr:hypothetical protein [Prosthecobacter sp.]MDI1315320.1 hypothetical protein [Prosthecobacter sp.]
MTPRFFYLVVIACLAACQHKQDATTPARNLEEEARLHTAGLILLPDLQHASAWEKLIHADMGVPGSKIEVVAGPGFTTVTIRDLKNRADIERVAQELRSIAEKKPDKFGVTKVEVRLNNAATTINPFVLPTESAPATPNPGSVLPTLSLPPLRIDGR